MVRTMPQEMRRDEGLDDRIADIRVEMPQPKHLRPCER